MESSPSASLAPRVLPALTVTRNFTAEDEAQLRVELERCSASTFEAACQFRQTGNIEHLPVIIFGVVECYVEPARRPRLRLKGASENLRLTEDLGIDSLTMMEIVMLAEEILQVTIDNEVLPELRTMGEIRDFLETKFTRRPIAGAACRLAS